MARRCGAPPFHISTCSAPCDLFFSSRLSHSARGRCISPTARRRLNTLIWTLYAVVPSNRAPGGNAYCVYRCVTGKSNTNKCLLLNCLRIHFGNACNPLDI